MGVDLVGKRLERSRLKRVVAVDRNGFDPAKEHDLRNPFVIETAERRIEIRRVFRGCARYRGNAFGDPTMAAEGIVHAYVRGVIESVCEACPVYGLLSQEWTQCVETPLDQHEIAVFYGALYESIPNVIIRLDILDIGSRENGLFKCLKEFSN